jgi:hypothetical protein
MRSGFLCKISRLEYFSPWAFDLAQRGHFVCELGEFVLVLQDIEISGRAGSVCLYRGNICTIQDKFLLKVCTDILASGVCFD